MVPTWSASGETAGVRRITAVLAPKALTRFATSWPIGPKPTISQLVCDISRKGVDLPLLAGLQLALLLDRLDHAQHLAEHVLRDRDALGAAVAQRVPLAEIFL